MAEQLHIVRGELLPGVTYASEITRDELVRCAGCGKRHWRLVVGEIALPAVVLCRSCLMAGRDMTVTADGRIERDAPRPHARCMRWER